MGCVVGLLLYCHNASPPPSRQENAVNGDHLWMETSCSGELCYLGEDACLLKTAVSTHTVDIGQLQLPRTISQQH